MDWLKEKDKLIKMVFEEKIPYDKIGEKYNVTGGAIRNVFKREFKIKLPTRRKINPKETFNKEKGDIIVCLNCGKIFKGHPKQHRKFCCNKCSHQYKHKMKYKEFLENPNQFNYANYNPRNFKDFILEEQHNKCAICGMPPIWNGKKLVFILDHIDGHASNNSRANLRCICPNCDSQLDTYKSKNKNSDRAYRIKYTIYHT